MIPRAVLSILEEYAARLRARFGDRLEHVRLYGSYARGEAHEDSDIDVLAVVRDLSWREKVEAVESAAELTVTRGLTVSAVVMDPRELERLVGLETRFAVDAMREGIVV